jgi:hypothetical protein
MNGATIMFVVLAAIAVGALLYVIFFLIGSLRKKPDKNGSTPSKKRQPTVQ